MPRDYDPSAIPAVHNLRNIAPYREEPGFEQVVFRGIDQMIGLSRITPERPDSEPHTHPYEQMNMLVNGRLDFLGLLSSMSASLRAEQLSLRDRPAIRTSPFSSWNTKYTLSPSTLFAVTSEATLPDQEDVVALEQWAQADPLSDALDGADSEVSDTKDATRDAAGPADAPDVESDELLSSPSLGDAL